VEGKSGGVHVYTHREELQLRQRGFQMISAHSMEIHTIHQQWRDRLVRAIRLTDGIHAIEPIVESVSIA
jgi:hypothetical protein